MERFKASTVNVEIDGSILDSSSGYGIGVDHERYGLLLSHADVPQGIINKNRLVVGRVCLELPSALGYTAGSDIFVFCDNAWNVYSNFLDRGFVDVKSGMDVASEIINMTLLHETRHLSDRWNGKLDSALFRKFFAERRANGFAKSSSTSNAFKSVIRFTPA